MRLFAGNDIDALMIKAGTDEFFVASTSGPVVLVVHTHAGQKYLQSEREKQHPDDLLTLSSAGVG